MILPMPAPEAITVLNELAIRKAPDAGAADGHHLVRAGFDDQAEVAAGDHEAAEHHAETTTMPMIWNMTD